MIEANTNVATQFKLTGIKKGTDVRLSQLFKCWLIVATHNLYKYTTYLTDSLRFTVLTLNTYCCE